MKKNTVNWDEPGAVGLLEASLKNNHVVLGASDTVLGLLAEVSIEGKQALDMVKIRENKPYIVLVGSSNKLPLFIDQQISQNLDKLINYCWPGPLTLILKANSGLFYLKQSTVAIRVPKHVGLLNLLKFFPGLFSTSANLSGHPVPKNIEEVDKKILESIDYIVLDKQESLNILPSTILDCTSEQIKVVREGAYNIQELEKIYGESFIK